MMPDLIANMPEEIDLLRQKYEKMFSVPAPSSGFFITREFLKKALEKAIKRGSKLTDDDLPKINVNEVV